MKKRSFSSMVLVMMITMIITLTSSNVNGGTTEVAVTNCIDSDGDNYLTDGTVTYTNGTVDMTITEACTDGTYSLYSTLTEHTCNGTNVLVTATYYCDDCTTRTCGTTRAYRYADTDGGNFSLVPGYTNYTIEIKDDEATVYTTETGPGSHDYCSTTKDLREYYIDSRKISLEYPTGKLTSTTGTCSKTVGPAYSCISLDGPDRCGIACTDASSCGGYSCIASAYCLTSCSSDDDCDTGEGYTCDTSKCTKSTSSAAEICTGGSDEDGDGTVDYGGIDTDSDGDIEYKSGCVKRSVFVKYGDSSVSCPKRSSYQCQSLSDSTFGTCPSGTYIPQDSECSARLSVPKNEQGFFARFLAWIIGN